MQRPPALAVDQGVQREFWPRARAWTSRFALSFLPCRGHFPQILVAGLRKEVSLLETSALGRVAI